MSLNIYEFHTDPSKLKWHEKYESKELAITEDLRGYVRDLMGNDREQGIKRGTIYPYLRYYVNQYSHKKDMMENVIAKIGEPYMCLIYSLITKEPFELGEKFISKVPHYSFEYAEQVLDGPFKMGEPAISKNAGLSLLYARNILSGRFEMGEQAMSKDDAYAYHYALQVLKGRFEMAEQTILDGKTYISPYTRNVLNKYGFKVKGFNA